MNTDIARATEIIREMKGLLSEPEGFGVLWPIRDLEMNVVGYMRGFDRVALGDAYLTETMAKWHTFYRECFLTQFVVTPENKRSWLQNSVLGNDRKMLFLIETTDGKIVGQDGFSVEEDGVCCLDGTMRWARGGHPDLFRFDILERVSIAYFLLNCRDCVAEVFSDNHLAAENLLSLGFTAEEEIPLLRIDEGDTMKYVKCPGSSCRGTEKRLLKMTMDRDFFAGKYKKVIETPCWVDSAFCNERGW